jgi:hypothetical protein
LRRMLWEPPWCCVALAVIAIFLVFLWFSFPVTPWSYGQLVNILPTNENRRPAIAGSFKKKITHLSRVLFSSAPMDIITNNELRKYLKKYLTYELLIFHSNILRKHSQDGTCFTFYGVCLVEQKIGLVIYVW